MINIYFAFQDTKAQSGFLKTQTADKRKHCQILRNKSVFGVHVFHWIKNAKLEVKHHIYFWNAYSKSLPEMHEAQPTHPPWKANTAHKTELFLLPHAGRV